MNIVNSDACRSTCIIFRFLPRLTLLLLFVLSAGCGKKPIEADKASEPTAATNIVEESVENAVSPPPPSVFDEPQKQARFEELYGQNETAFHAPTPGTLLRIFKKSGTRIEGEMARYTRDGIVVSTPDGQVIIKRNEMADVTTEKIFVDEFSKVMAERQVRVESAAGNQADINAVFFDPANINVTEVRRFTAERMYVRLGPGRYFAKVEDRELFRGQNVYVVHETNDWICIKATPDAAHVLGWIPKFSSFMVNADKKEIITREVNKLFDSGFLIDINPQKNEALVDWYEWRILDTSSAEGISRLLAIHCGQQKGSRLFWVDIKDALSGRTIAEYSASKGLKVHM